MNILNIAADITKLIKKQNQDAEVTIYETIVFSKMNDKFPLWYYQPKVVSLYIYALKV